MRNNNNAYVGLGVPDDVIAGRIDEYFDQSRRPTMTTHRLNYYPAPTPGQEPKPVTFSPDDGTPLSCETHTDGSVLTILYQDKLSLSLSLSLYI